MKASWWRSFRRKHAEKWSMPCVGIRSARRPRSSAGVTSEPGLVTMRTAFGTTRIVDMLPGDQLPRIC